MDPPSCRGGCGAGAVAGAQGRAQGRVLGRVGSGMSGPVIELLLGRAGRLQTPTGNQGRHGEWGMGHGTGTWAWAVSASPSLLRCSSSGWAPLQHSHRPDLPFPSTPLPAHIRIHIPARMSACCPSPSLVCTCLQHACAARLDMACQHGGSDVLKLAVAAQPQGRQAACRGIDRQAKWQSPRGEGRNDRRGRQEAGAHCWCVEKMEQLVALCLRASLQSCSSR